MEEQHDLAKWLAGEMTEKELLAFQNTREFVTYNKIATYSAQLETSAFDEAVMYQNIMNYKKNAPKIIPFYRSAFFRVAAILAIGMGLMFLAKPLVSETQYAENGAQTTFLLPDDSQVTLNAGSEAFYKKWDWSNNRALELKGEAFFKVAKGKKFDVNTTLGTVTVVGTQFNVKARNKRFEVECFEGKVKVVFGKKEVFLTKGQILTVQNGEMMGSTSTPTNLGTPCWMRREMCFNSVPLSEIIAEIERQYNVSVTQKNITSDEKFTGKLPSDDLQKGLTIISKTYHLKFEITKNTVILYPDE